MFWGFLKRIFQLDWVNTVVGTKRTGCSSIVAGSRDGKLSVYCLQMNGKAREITDAHKGLMLFIDSIQSIQFLFTRRDCHIVS